MYPLQVYTQKEREAPRAVQTCAWHAVERFDKKDDIGRLFVAFNNNVLK
jgi:hypothetical protein